MLPARSTTLAGLIVNHAGLEMICRAPDCGKVSSFAPYERDAPIKGTVMQLVIRYSEQTTLDQLAQKVVCPGCRGEDFDLQPWAGRHGPVVGSDV